MNGHDNEGDKGIGSKEDEDNSKASLDNDGDNNSGDNKKNEGTEEEKYAEGAEDSDLTEIGSSSYVSIVEVAPASGSRRKGIQLGRQ